MSEDRREMLAGEALKLSRRSLEERFPFLGEAAAYPAWRGTKGRSGTDGVYLYWNMEDILQIFLAGRQELERLYLHMLYHDLYGHPFRAPRAGRRIWNAACDLMTEYRIDRLCLEAEGGRIPEERSRIYRILRENGGLFSGRELLRWLAALRPEELAGIEAVFARDSHLFWICSDSGDAAGEKREQMAEDAGIRKKTEAAHRWRTIFETLPAVREEHRRQAGGSLGRGGVSIILEKERGHDFRQFLKRFAVEQEEMCLDMDSFDYIPYDYSRRMYGRLVFLEPLEYREMKKLRQFVIAIDTSGSCSGEIVRSFLEETWEILNERDNFFREMEIHMIQCDCTVQEHVKITCEEEWKDYLEHIEIKGHGDTDFTPVFRLVDRMREQGELRELKGLLYFTDGDGICPSDPPAYDTAFVFLNAKLRKGKIPDWAQTLTLDRELERRQ